MGLQIVKGNIVEMGTEAIVNAANSGLMRGGGVCGAIFYAAGARELQEECSRKAPCPTGSAAVTGGYQLKAKYIIHAVGPVWNGGNYGEEKQLIRAYQSALEAAKEKNCASVAFPLISAGIYGYPRESAIRTAVLTITEFLKQNQMEVYLVLFELEAMAMAQEMFPQYIAKKA